MQHRDPRHLPPSGPRHRGGQPGNLNALRHGRRSRRYLATVRALAGDPGALDIIRTFARIARRSRPVRALEELPGQAAGLQTNPGNPPQSESAGPKKTKDATNESDHA